MTNKKIAIFGLVSILFVCFVSAVTITSAATTSVKSSKGEQILEDMINAESARVAELNVRLDPKLGITHTLQKKSNGNDVKLLQQFLKVYGVYPEGLITGYFGPLTEQAVKKFQEKESIDSVGIAGPKTRARIVEISISQQKSKKNPTMPAVTSTFAATPTSTLLASPIGVAVPAIVDAVLATDAADNGAAVAPVVSFASTTQNIYAVLSLKNAMQDTKVAYIRYYGNTYVDSEISHPSRSGLAYFHFQWSLKPGNNRLPGNYTLVFYLNDKSAKTIQYSIY